MFLKIEGCGIFSKVLSFSVKNFTRNTPYLLRNRKVVENLLHCIID